MKEPFEWPSPESIDEMIWQKAFNDRQMDMLAEHETMVEREAKLEQLLLNPAGEHIENPWIDAKQYYGQSILHPSSFAFLAVDSDMAVLEAQLEAANEPSPQMELDFRTWRQKAWEKRKLLTSFVQSRGKSKKKGGRYDSW